VAFHLKNRPRSQETCSEFKLEVSYLRRLALGSRSLTNPTKTITTNNAVSRALERSNPEVRSRLAFSTDYANPCAAIVALLDNRQAVVATDRNPRPILLHRSLQLDPERGRRQRVRWARLVWPVARMRCIRGLDQAPGGDGRNQKPYN